MKKQIVALLPFVFLLGIIGCFFSPFFLNSEIPYAGDFTGSDLTELNVPLKYAAAQSLKHGEVPLWTNTLSSGFPLLAEGQAGAFYPLTLLYVFLPVGLATNLYLLFVIFLASLFTYLWCRKHDVSVAAACFGALSFALSAFFIFRIKHVNLISAAAFIPLVFYCIDQYVSSRKKIWLFFVPAVLSVQFFAGHPQMSYITVVASLFYYAVRTFSKNQIAPWFFKGIIVWSALGLITFGLSAIQFFPTWELTMVSARTETISAQYEASFASGYNPKNIVTLVLPFSVSNPAAGDYDKTSLFWEDSLYFGALAFILAVVGAIVAMRQKKHLALYALIALAIFFLAGKYNLLYKIAIDVIPVMNLFRFPQRFSVLLLLSGAVFAAMGFDTIIAFVKSLSKKLSDRQRVWLSGCVAVVLVALSLVELFYVGYRYLGSLPYDYFSPPLTVQTIKEHVGLHRVNALSWEDSWQAVIDVSQGWQYRNDLFMAHRSVIPPNLNTIYGLETADDRAWGEGGQLATGLYGLYDSLRFGNLLTRDVTRNTLLLDRKFIVLYGMQNVKYFTSFYQLEGPGLRQIREISASPLPAVRLYENEYVLPRAFGVFSAIVEPNLKKTVVTMTSTDFEPSKTIFVDAPVPSMLTGEGAANVSISQYDDRTITTDVTFSKDGMLFVSLTHYPGWHATIDGTSARIYRANGAFSAVAVPAGDHVVTFFYKNTLFSVGAILSLVTLCLWLVGLWLLSRQKEKC